MKKPPTSNEQLVLDHLEKYPVAIQQTIAYLRQIMQEYNEELREHIKWNAVAYYYHGPMKPSEDTAYKRDLVVLHVRKDVILCIFPTGHVLTKNLALLEGNYADGRRMVTITNVEDIQSKSSAFKAIVDEWLEKVVRP